MKKFYEPDGSWLSIADRFSSLDHTTFTNISARSKLFLLFTFLLLATESFSQVLNVTQASVIEDGYGKTPNLTGASSVFVKGNYAYVVGTGDVLEILDITLP